MNLKQMLALSAVAGTLLCSQVSQAFTYTLPVSTNGTSTLGIGGVTFTPGGATFYPAGSIVTVNLGFTLSNNFFTGVPATVTPNPAFTSTYPVPANTLFVITDGANNPSPVFPVKFSDFSVGNGGTATPTSFVNNAGFAVSATYFTNTLSFVVPAGGLTDIGYDSLFNLFPAPGGANPQLAATYSLTGVITVTDVPEPGSIAMGVSGALVGFGLLRRRRK